ncbi:MAG: hypothetical protein FJ290_09465 [Planctomycetes bacterium]|nr:hypothetical protein [Planctomycetota bacterium]
MSRVRTQVRKGLVAPEVVAVVAVVGLMLALGYSIYKGARLNTKVAVAENNLKHVGLALDLFFHRYGAYPPQGADLVAVLAPYVRNLEVFRNPLANEDIPGRTLTELYREPALRELDGPNHYITAFVSADGSTAVLLRSGSNVERLNNLSLPSDPAGVVAVLSAVPAQGTMPAQPQPEPGPEPDPGTGDVGGDINLNPNNSDFEFDLRKPDGSSITADDLRDSSGALVYIGEAVRVLFKPKGNGNQSTLTLNGQVYRLENMNRYLIVRLQGGSMTVHLFNSKAGRGAAMGKWWLAITATGARISICNCQGECQCG